MRRKAAPEVEPQDISDALLQDDMAMPLTEGPRLKSQALFRQGPARDATDKTTGPALTVPWRVTDHNQINDSGPRLTFQIRSHDD